MCTHVQCQLCSFRTCTNITDTYKFQICGALLVVGALLDWRPLVQCPGPSQTPGYATAYEYAFYESFLVFTDV